MFGNNPIRRPLLGDGSTLEVQEVFKTLQGEGPFVGTPAIFVRLGGCNLACSFCDTEFESFNTTELNALLAQIDQLSGRLTNWTHRLIVITGGEPLRQPIEALTESLLAHDYAVQIETNGTLYRPLNPKVSIICSPKNNGHGYAMIRPDLLPHITAFKFIISASDAYYNHVPEIGQSEYSTPVYVQPMDNQDEIQNINNQRYTIELAHKYGYTLSLQTHKILGLP